MTRVRSLKCTENFCDFAPNREKCTAKKIPTKMNGMKSAPKGRSSSGALPGSLFFPYTVMHLLGISWFKNVRYAFISTLPHGYRKCGLQVPAYASFGVFLLTFDRNVPMNPKTVPKREKCKLSSEQRVWGNSIGVWRLYLAPKMSNFQKTTNL